MFYCPGGYIVFVSREVMHMDCTGGYTVFVSREVIHGDCPGGYIVFVLPEVIHMVGSLCFTVLVGV